jgi:uncharacterized membrane protein HdeD (DUF308 family)
MEIIIVRNWKTLALRGLAGVLFGLVAFLWPSITLVALVLLFGGYAIADGVLAITAAIRPEPGAQVWILVLEGLFGIGVGLGACVWTGMTAVVLVDFVALWAIVTGILELALAARLRREIPGELLMGIAGATSVLLGIVMLVWPKGSALVIVILLGGYALFFGATMVALAFRLRRWGARFEAPPRHNPSLHSRYHAT